MGRTCFKKRAVSFFMLKVSITPAAVPKRINFIPVSLPRGRNSPEYGKSGSIAVSAGASVLTQFNWPYRYSMLRRFACMAFLSNDWTISPINSLPLTILAWMIRSFGVSCVARHWLKMPGHCPRSDPMAENFFDLPHFFLKPSLKARSCQSPQRKPPDAPNSAEYDIYS